MFSFLFFVCIHKDCQRWKSRQTWIVVLMILKHLLPKSSVKVYIMLRKGKMLRSKCWGTGLKRYRSSLHHCLIGMLCYVMSMEVRKEKAASKMWHLTWKLMHQLFVRTSSERVSGGLWPNYATIRCKTFSNPVIWAEEYECGMPDSNYC